MVQVQISPEKSVDEIYEAIARLPNLVLNGRDEWGIYTPEGNVVGMTPNIILIRISQGEGERYKNFMERIVAGEEFNHLELRVNVNPESIRTRIQPYLKSLEKAVGV